MFNVAQLSNILKVAAGGNTPAAKLLSSLISFDVLKDLTDSKYLVLTTQNQQKTLHSDKHMNVHKHYWAEIDFNQKTPTVKTLLQSPRILSVLKDLPFEMNLKQAIDILRDPKQMGDFKQNVLEMMSKAATKEEFNSLSQLMLSLSQHTLSIPLHYGDYLGLLQMKKRYNKKTKKFSVDFYAALALLGPIKGVILLVDETPHINLNVNFENTKRFLEEELESMPFKHMTINLLEEQLEPLHNAQGLLDLRL